MRICVLGLGQLGRAFAGRALAGGHQVAVWNRTAGRAEELLTAGAVEFLNAADAAATAEVVLVVVADDAAVREVCDAGGVFGALADDAALCVVSTVSPDTIRELAGTGPADRVLDTPVMGSPTAITAGQGRFLVGGSTEMVAALAPLWRDLGAGYTHCGPVGSGAVMKIVSNLLLITGVTALAEGIATARGHGISDELISTVFGNSVVTSQADKIRLDSVLSADHPGWFGPELARKDVRLALGLAEQAGVGVRIAPATEQLLGSVIDAGGSWPDFTAVIEALRGPAAD